MRTKSVIFVMLFVITFVLASCRFGAERFSLGDLPDTAFPALDGSEKDSFVTEKLKPILDEVMDSIDVDELVDKVKDEISENKTDSLQEDEKDTLKVEIKDIAALDTLAMDSLQRAIWRHNRAIDDSIQLDSMNRKRKTASTTLWNIRPMTRLSMWLAQKPRSCMVSRL